MPSDVITVMTYENEPIGTITLVNGKLRGNNDVMQDIANSFEKRAQANNEDAFTLLDGWQNGYLFASSDPDAHVSEE
jgi:hypothetical protein